MQTFKIIGLLLVIVIAVGAVVFQAQQLAQQEAARKAHATSAAQMGMTKAGGGMGGKMPGMGGAMAGMGDGRGLETLGNKKAKVVVEAAVPLDPECHAKTIKMLRSLAQEEPDRVCVKIAEKDSSEGMVILNKHEAGCASVFVNDQNSFELEETPGKKRHVEFHDKPNDPTSPYHSEDVIDVVNMKLTEEYGHGLAEDRMARIKAAGEEKKAES